MKEGPQGPSGSGALPWVPGLLTSLDSGTSSSTPSITEGQSRPFIMNWAGVGFHLGASQQHLLLMVLFPVGH